MIKSPVKTMLSLTLGKGETALPDLCARRAFSYRTSAYHKKLVCICAAKAKCRVYFPDYHLTPEYPYPAAYADVVART